MKVTVITAIPSPYQVELFDTLQKRGQVDLTAVYVSAYGEGRQWALPDMKHQAHFIEDSLSKSAHAVRRADLAVFGNYVEPVVRKWMRKRAARKAPWVFWGERPGFKSSRLLGRWYRKVRLWPLYRSNVPIWGIGQWAVERYRYEFGDERPYANIPYYSNLERFRNASPQTLDGSTARRILYAGSLSKRKGVDLLARAFANLAEQHPELHLDIAGDGALRTEMEDTLAPVASQVTLHGFVAWDELPGLYAAADVLCVPSRYDGWALVVPEGLASGLPVIATDRMGAAIDLIKPSVNGWRVPAGNQSALYDALNDAATVEAKKLSTMGKQAQENIFSAHTLAHGANNVERAARKALTMFGYASSPRVPS